MAIKKNKTQIKKEIKKNNKWIISKLQKMMLEIYLIWMTKIKKNKILSNKQINKSLNWKIMIC